MGDEFAEIVLLSSFLTYEYGLNIKDEFRNEYNKEEERRKAEELIIEGKVSVNGKIVTELGTKIETNRDKVSVDDKLIKAGKRVVIVSKENKIMNVKVLSENAKK